MDVVQALEARTQGGGARRDRLGGVRAQSLGDQRGQGGRISWRHTPAHQFRRADAQAIQIMTQFCDRQTNATGQKASFAQGLGGSLPTTKAGGLNRELMRLGGALVGGKDRQAKRRKRGSKRNASAALLPASKFAVMPG